MTRLRFHECDGRIERGEAMSCDHCLNRLRASVEAEARDTELTRLRAEVAALRDKARRFKGWRVRYEYFGYPGHGRAREWMPWAVPATFSSLRKARAYLRSLLDGDANYRNGTLHRVYKPAAGRKESR